jgi:hypothetical protein
MEEPTLEQLIAYRKILIERVPRDKVGAELGYTGRHAARLAKAALEWMRAEQMDQISTLRTMLTDRLEYIYGEALRAYRISKQPKVVKTEKTNANGETEEIEQTTGQASGNPAFLRLAKDAVEVHADLWKGLMTSSDRGQGVRAAGKTQLQLLDAMMEKLANQRRTLTARTEPVNGDGDRA